MKKERKIVSKDMREKILKVPIQSLQMEYAQERRQKRVIYKPCYFADYNEITEVIFYPEKNVKNQKNKDSPEAIKRKIQYAKKLVFQIPLPGTRFLDVEVVDVDAHSIKIKD